MPARKVRRVVRRRGRGIFGDIGGHLGSFGGNALGGLFGLGRKRRPARRRGRGIFGDIGGRIGSLGGNALGGLFGLGRRRRPVRRVRRRGAGLWDTVKSAARNFATKAKENLALKAAKYVGKHKYGNPNLGRLTQKAIYQLGSLVGVGRRRRVARRRRGGMSYRTTLGGMPMVTPFMAGVNSVGGRRRRGGRSYRQLMF